MRATEREKRILSDSIINDRLEIVELKAALEEQSKVVGETLKDVRRLIADGYALEDEVVDGGSPEDGIPPSTRPTCEWCEEDVEACSCLGNDLRSIADRLEGVEVDGSRR